MALMLVICVALISTRAEFYVSPNGKQKGTGTKEDPFDIVTALSGRKSVQPGDIVWLRGGIYTLPADPRTEKFTIECRLKGTPEKPIIVRQMPGERATIDGALTLAGSDTWYWGIEVRGTRDTTRAEGNDCVTVVGPRTKMINLVIHRGSMGSGFWSPAVDAEQYGNLFFDFGYPAEDRGHGHACYTQNETGLSGYWTISCSLDMDGTSTIIQNRARLPDIILKATFSLALAWQARRTIHPRITY